MTLIEGSERVLSTKTAFAQSTGHGRRRSIGSDSTGKRGSLAESCGCSEVSHRRHSKPDPAVATASGPWHAPASFWIVGLTELQSCTARVPRVWRGGCLRGGKPWERPATN